MARPVQASDGSTTGPETPRTSVSSGADDQLATAHDYDRWLAQDSLSARWINFWLSPKRTFCMNTPARKLPAALALKSTDKVLDVGCGYGGLLLYLRKRGGVTAAMEGIDCSQRMVDRARREIGVRGLDDVIHMRQGWATDLPYSDGSFDVVLCTFVVKHLSDALFMQMLREVTRVLKPGGRFCVWEAGPSRYAFMQVWNLKLLRLGVSVLHLRAVDELRGLLEKAGFRDLQPCGHGLYYFYPPLPRVGFIARRPNS